MLTTIPAEDILALVHSTHRHPHEVLGIHTTEVSGKPVVAVRILAPRARDVVVVEKDGEGGRYGAERVHADGLFEAIVLDRHETFSYTLHMTDYEGNEYDMEDPYVHRDVVTEYDRYLFNRAVHYRIYDKMGAHLVELDDMQGVLFSVWAPNAQRVSVVGDFNGWDGRQHPMKLHEDSGIWELFVPRINSGEIYKYEIRAQDGRVLLKADPYARASELRPKTGSVVCAVSEFAWADDEWLERRAKTAWRDEPVLIYEVHPGSWRRKPDEDNRSLTYRELADELVPYAVDMGYTHIELMAVQEHPFDGSWGYQVTGYFAPTCRYGSPDDFKYFIDVCHRNGLGVILDWVPGHFPKDPHGLVEFDGTALYEHADPRMGEHPDWGTKVFNYSRFEVANFLISNGMFWVDEYHLDGLRVDAVASMLYLDYSRKEGEWIPNPHGGRENLDAVEFIRHLNSIIHQYYPGVLMIAEESTSWPMVSKPCDMGGLGFGFKWNMGWMHDVLAYMQQDPIHRQYHHNELTFTMLYAFSENFILPFSHDEVVHGKGSLIGRMPGDYWQKFANLRALYAFMYSFPGKVMTFMGGEFGQFDEWNHDASLQWNLLEYDAHRSLQHMVRDLNRLVAAHTALYLRDCEPDGFRWINGADSGNSVLAYIRQGATEDDHVIVVMNFTPVVRHDYRIGVPFGGRYREIFNSDDPAYGGSGVLNGERETIDESRFGFPHTLSLSLPPLAGMVFAPIRA